MYETFHSVIKIYYLILAVIGVPVNLVTIVILSRGHCGLSTCTTRYLVAMATADLLVIITEVILRQIRYYYFPLCFLDITPVCSIIYVLSCAATECSVWFTVTFTFDRFVAICCQKLKTKYCTEKTAAVVLATTCILLCLTNIPFYFRYESYGRIDNVPYLCVTKPVYYTDPRWVGFKWFHTVLTPLLPFALILLLNILTVRHILVASRVRKRLRGQSKGENRSDPEMESRRKSMILLFTLSANFILLWSVYVLYFLYYNIAGSDPNNSRDFVYFFGHVGTVLLNLSCCTNTFIYGATQSKFREQTYFYNIKVLHSFDSPRAVESLIHALVISRLTLSNVLLVDIPFTRHGTPAMCLTDNGGEFANNEFRDMCENMNIIVMNPAAECSFSNGLCERNQVALDLFALLFPFKGIYISSVQTISSLKKNVLQQLCDILDPGTKEATDIPGVMSSASRMHNGDSNHRSRSETWSSGFCSR
ncbi:probable G-protein coupled receptor 139 [Heterodontus francisci]|uniref:probable G-protein coupled receptor 139 n=1 Tax=Heterodontus francisci TaxID=7792 RepID=UPI00355AF8E0